MKVIGRGVLLLVVCLAASAVGADSPVPVSPERVQRPPPNLPLPVPVEAHTLEPDAFLRPSDQEEIDTQSIVAQDRTPFPNCRLGVAVVSNPDLLPFTNYEDLNLGAFVNFRTGDRNPALPAAVEYIQTIRLEQNKLTPNQCAAQSPTCNNPPGPPDCGFVGPVYRDCYTDPITYTLKSPSSFAELRARVAANPGSLWLVGNEPDRRSWPNEAGTGWVGQDETLPEVYARAYCEISREIHDSDPTARVAPAGVVQGTPLRMEYLDRVWAEYPNVCNGRNLGDDVDVWNMHNFVLREASLACYCDWCETWGAEIPAGLDDCAGKLYSGYDNASIDYFKEQIVRFRTWMRDKGEREKPLIISEGGLNMGTWYIAPDHPWFPDQWPPLESFYPPLGTDNPNVRWFIYEALSYILTKTDADLGYSLDGNRLVQQFTWWSMDAEAWDGSTVDSLYTKSGSRKLYGNYWVEYLNKITISEATTPRRNLLVSDVETVPSMYIRPTGPVTFTLQASVHNNGNTRTDSGDGINVDFYQGTPEEPGNLIASQVITDMYGCAGEESAVAQTWVISDTSGLSYPWYVEVETQPGESSGDNIGTGSALIASDLVYLPYVTR